MATETELENLIVRLTGDGSEYKRMLEQAQAETDKSAKAVEDASKRIEAHKQKMEAFAQSAVQALAAIGLGAVLREALGNFQEAELISLRLNATLQSNGREVDSLRERYEEFAASLERTTTAEDDQILSMLQSAEMFGVTGDAAERAVRNALALAAQTGGSAEGMMRLTASLEQGVASPLQRMIPTLRGIEGESEKAAEAQRVLAGMFSVVEAEAGSSSGQMKVLMRDYGNLLEDFGAFLAQGLRPVTDGLKAVVAWFRELDPATKKVITVLAVLGAGLVALGPALGLVKLILPVIIQSISMAGPLIWSVINPMRILTAVTYLYRNSLVALRMALKAIGIGLIIVAIAMLVEELGGLEAIWGNIKGAVIGFFNWLAPIMQSIADVLLAAWEVLRPMVQATIGFIVSVLVGFVGICSGIWESIFGDATVNWEGIKNGIIDAMIMCEFIIKNFGQAWELMVTMAALEWVKFTDYIDYLLTQVGTVVEWFGRNWQKVMTDVVNFGVTVFSNMVSNIVRLLTNLPGLIAGSVNWDDIWRPLTEGFQASMDELPQITTRAASAVQQEVQRMADAQFQAFAQNAVDFNAARRREIEAANRDRDRQDDREQERLKNMAKALEKFDAAVAGSAESLSRIAAFQDVGGGVAADTRERGRGGPRGGGIGDLLGNLGRGLGGVWAAAKQWAKEAWEAIKQWAFGVWNSILNAAIEAWTFLTAPAIALWELITVLATGAWDWAIQKATEFWNWATTIVTQIFQGDFLGAWNTFWAGVTGTATATWDAIRDRAFEIWEAIRRTVTDVFNNLPGVRQIAGVAQTLGGGGGNPITGIARTVGAENNPQVQLLGRAVDYLGQMARDRGITLNPAEWF